MYAATQAQKIHVYNDDNPHLICNFDIFFPLLITIPGLEKVASESPSLKTSRSTLTHSALRCLRMPTFNEENHLALDSIISLSINTQVIIQNRALSLARYLGLSADNHLDGQNGCQ